MGVFTYKMGIETAALSIGVWKTWLMFFSKPIY